jgi:transposase
MPECNFEQENIDLKKENAKLLNEVSYLKEQLEWFKRQIFGPKSEKIIPENNEEQLLLPGYENTTPQENTPPKTIAAHKRRKPNRNGQDSISLPSDIPVERQVIDIPDNEKIYPETGKPLVKIGEDITRKIACKPGKYYVKEIVRPKYALPKERFGGIITANLPESLITRCQADERLLADILTKKFNDHLPLYRIEEILSRDDIHISRQVLCGWVRRCGQALKPLYDEMLKHIIESENIFVDETPIPLQVKGKGKLQKAYMWVIVGGKSVDPPCRIYYFSTNRKHKHAEDLLSSYIGLLHSDRYGAYESLVNTKDNEIIWCPCFAHIRRKFFDAQSGDLEFREYILTQIQDLFILEQNAWKLSPEERLVIRREQEVPIIDEMIEKVKKRLIKGKILPKSKFKEAMGYFCSSIPYLKNYIKHPFARIDNNVAERAVRPLALGRKNWLFIGSEDSGESAGVILSLIQSCRALGIHPAKYLEDVMRRLMSHNSRKLYELLPHNWQK